MKLINFTKRAAQAGFTMIELLVVIAILGILAVVVLGAINPLEQINRGRDTAARADAEAMIGAVERFNANLGRFPWENPAVPATLALPQRNLVVGAAFQDPVAVCPVVNSLGQGVTGSVTCLGTQEIKSSMVERISRLAGERIPVIYFRGDSNGDSTYVCFRPQSDSFRQQARERCNPPAGVTLPTDFPLDTAVPNVCAAGDEMVCLP